MKLFLLIFFSLSLFGFETKTNLKVQTIHYDKYDDETLLDGDIKFEYKKDTIKLVSLVEFLYSNQYSSKQYIHINEVYLQKEYDSHRVSFGKEIKFLGEVEGYNISDIFNQKKYLDDPFDKSQKMGSYIISDTLYFEESNLEMGMKFYEEDIRYPQSDEPYYPFELDFDKDLQTSDSRYTPSVYLKYAFSVDALDMENKIMLYRGYDQKRLLEVNENFELYQKAYRVDKYIYTLNKIYKDSIFKMEAVYSDVDTKSLSDYFQGVLGIEHNLYDIGGVDIGIFGEYYRYIYTKKDLIEDIDISEIYDDDMFMALKINFNDVGSSELKSGLLYDLHSKERVMKNQFKTRIKDIFLVGAEVLYLSPSGDSSFEYFDNDLRVKLSLSYSF